MSWKTGASALYLFLGTPRISEDHAKRMTVPVVILLFSHGIQRDAVTPAITANSLGQNLPNFIL